MKTPSSILPVGVLMVLAVFAAVLSSYFIQRPDCRDLCDQTSGAPCPTGSCLAGQQKAGLPMPSWWTTREAARPPVAGIYPGCNAAAAIAAGPAGGWRSVGPHHCWSSKRDPALPGMTLKVVYINFAILSPHNSKNLLFIYCWPRVCNLVNKSQGAAGP